MVTNLYKTKLYKNYETAGSCQKCSFAHDVELRGRGPAQQLPCPGPGVSPAVKASGNTSCICLGLATAASPCLCLLSPGPPAISTTSRTTGAPDPLRHVTPAEESAPPATATPPPVAEQQQKTLSLVAPAPLGGQPATALPPLPCAADQQLLALLLTQLKADELREVLHTMARVSSDALEATLKVIEPRLSAASMTKAEAEPRGSTVTPNASALSIAPASLPQPGEEGQQLKTLLLLAPDPLDGLMMDSTSGSGLPSPVGDASDSMPRLGLPPPHDAPPMATGGVLPRGLFEDEHYMSIESFGEPLMSQSYLSENHFARHLIPI